MAMLIRFILHDAGATAIEYSLIAGFVSLSVIFGAAAIGVQLDQIFMKVANAF